ncbi:hypothetical protein [Leptospira interrogans]|uniref:hypothetical protein n=1 Tax=Leptospira interrogans TaxID=173 RepID=UPI001F0FD6F3|nr:hypothetical protein [Leptospira interrogans]UMQ60474.1 hypothetical protein FH585_21370 [Leptospira interrogans]UMQ60568.1 hypothetical protein FH585_21265 [Leptospira interrogans]
MKYSVFILLLITLSFSIYSDNQTVNNDPSELQQEEPEEDRETLVDKQQEKIEEQEKRNKRKDEYLKTIKLFESINQFKVEREDNDVLRTKKKKLQQKEIISLNAKLKGLPISFASIKNESVTEETELSDYGKKAIKSYIRKLMTDPQTKELYAEMDEDNPFIKLAAWGYLMMGCGKKCEKKTGNFLAEFSYYSDYEYLGISKEKFYKLEIVKILTSEDEALKIKSNKYYNVSGKIDRFKFEDDIYGTAGNIKLYIK